MELLSFSQKGTGVARFALILHLLFAGPALADQAPADSSKPGDLELIGEKKAPLPHEFSLSHSYVGSADIKNGNSDLDEHSFRFSYGLRKPVTEEWTLHLGASYNRMDFGVPGRSPLPENLQTVAVTLGADYKISDQWMVFAALSPRMALVEEWGDTDSDSFQFGGVIGAGYTFHKDLSLRFGLAAQSSGEYPIIPIVGLKWAFAEKWTLNLGMPSTSLDYQVMDQLKVFVNAGFHSGSYTTGSSYGSDRGRPALNDKDLDYTEVRLGAGAEYAFSPNIALKGSVGLAAYRKFEFEDSYETELDPAPYVETALKIRF